MHTNISISIPKKLLEKIEKHIEGKNRSHKITKCLVKGIEIVTSKANNSYSLGQKET